MADISLAEFLATIPSRFGYTMDARHVVAVGMNDHGHAGPHMAGEWESAQGTDKDIAEHFARHVALSATANPEFDRFMLVGYGPEGVHRITALRDALLAITDLQEPLLLHVEGGTWRVSIGALGWTPPRNLPDLTAETVFAGLPTPLASRAQLAGRYEPSPAPVFGSIPTKDKDLFASSPPSFRAEVAIATLHKLTRPELDDPHQMALVAHLVTAGPKAVRDAVMLAAAQDAEHVAALVRVYRGAPKMLRPAMATAAGTAMYLSGGGSVETETILAHADRTGDNARLTLLVTASRKAALNPHAMREFLTTQMKPALEEADLQWTASLSSASFPARAASPERAGGDLHRPNVLRAQGRPEAER